MQITIHIDALQNDLAAVAQLGSEATAEVARQLSVVLEPALHRRLLDAITEAAHELTSQIPNGHVEVRIEGAEVRLAFVEEAQEPAAPPAGDDAYSARITLRLPESLKASVEERAAREGVSVNTYLVNLIARQGERSSGFAPRGGRRLVGYAES
jgi:predicted HicB family RNase H-like nuclease